MFFAVNKPFELTNMTDYRWRWWNLKVVGDISNQYCDFCGQIDFPLTSDEAEEIHVEAVKG